MTLLFVMVAACDGNSRSSPAAPDDTEDFSALLVTVTARSQHGIEIYQATLLLDGERIGSYTVEPDDAQSFAVFGGIGLGAERGQHTLDIRFDRLETSPATLEIRVLAHYQPDPFTSEELEIPDRTVMVREGGVVRVDIEA